MKFKTFFQLALFAIYTLCASHVNAASQKTTYVYDTLGQLKTVVDSVNGNRDFKYDSVGNRTLVTVGAQTTTLPIVAAPAKPVISGCTLVSSNSYQGLWHAVPGASYYLYSAGNTVTIVNDPLAQSAANLAAASDNPTGAPLDLQKYEIYYGDFDKDGIENDMYFHEKEKFIPIAGDIFIPIFLRGYSSFLQSKNTDNSYDVGVPYYLSQSERALAKRTSTDVGYVSGTSVCGGVQACSINGLCSPAANF